MGLSQYHQKRDFTKTKEPKGRPGKTHSGLFVIQKHKASHLHYDFRIELQGVLKSWAIPKGPSLDPKIKRLAMLVEDHPIEYGNFEGIIPKGQYGGGTVMLWDKGSWEPLDKKPLEAYAQGHLRFNLHAEKLHGRWDLIRFKNEKHWFLIKHRDAFARSEANYSITEVLDKSVLSRYTLEEIAKKYEQIWNSSKNINANTQKKSKKQGISLPKLPSASFPAFISPQLASLVEKPPAGKKWIHEIKFDGYRILAFKNGSKVILKSRNNNNWTNKLPFIAEVIGQLPFKDLILDGEVVVLDAKGRSDFQLLQNSLEDKQEASLIYFVFDLLYFEGHDLRDLPLVERKSLLQWCLTDQTSILHYSSHMEEGEVLYKHACRHDLEGIVSKLAEGTYQSKRSKEWLKIKCSKRQEFVIGGFTSPKGRRQHFGSLLLGVYSEQGSLDFAGHVGTGFTEKTLNELHQLFLKNKNQSNPFNTKPKGSSKAHWLKPQWVCEVAFTEWTHEGYLRHPSFKGLRLDKKARDVVRERAVPIREIQKRKQTHCDFTITNPNKLLYPEDKITKSDVLAYYAAISDYILPYLDSRPLTLLRCPSGYTECFFQRHFNNTTAKALHPFVDPINKEDKPYIYLKDKAGLFGLVQMGVLEIHPWGSKITHLEKPDVLVMDLDPAPNLPWSQVVAAAKEIRAHLAEYSLISFVKTTGGKGLHVVVPILPEYDWEEVKEFTRVFVQFLEKLHPEKYIGTMTKSKRDGKIFIDYLRNQRTATAIGPYSTRARLHAPVSIPLFWEELSDRFEDTAFTIKSVLKRLEQLKTDPWHDFWRIKQSLQLEKFQ